MPTDNGNSKKTIMGPRKRLRTRGLARRLARLADYRGNQERLRDQEGRPRLRPGTRSEGPRRDLHPPQGRGPPAGGPRRPVAVTPDLGSLHRRTSSQYSTVTFSPPLGTTRSAQSARPTCNGE